MIHLLAPLSRRTLAKLRRQPIWLVMAAAAWAPSVSAQPRYSLTDLGVLPGQASSIATSLNDRGDVIGYAAPASENFNQTAFLWSQGKLRSLGLASKGNYSYATAINSAGAVCLDADTGNFRPQSWVATSSGWINIFPNAGGNTHAVALSDSGTVCGFYAKSLSGWASSWKPALWTPDPKDPRKYRTTDLPVLVGLDPTYKGTTAIPTSCNNPGQAVGYAANEVIGQHACLWNADASHTIVDLGTFGDDGSSLAWSLNDLGQVVGESHPPFGSRPVLWNNDATHSLVELPLLPGDNYGAATRINRLGQIVGYSALAEAGTWNVGPASLVVWRDGGVFSLQRCLEAATANGWTLTVVNGLNNRGQIVGAAERAGVTHAVLLTPVTP